MKIEVVYALPDKQTIVEVELAPGARIMDALDSAHVRQALAGVTLAGCRLGIWGVIATPETRLRDRDRVELYRELRADPKQARRKRARQQRVSSTRR